MLVVWALAFSAHAQRVPHELSAAVEAGEDERALSLLEALPVDKRPGLRYLRARLLERLRRPAQAYLALPGAADGLPAGVAVDVERRRRELGIALGRFAEVCPEIERGLSAGRQRYRTWLDGAECALSRKEPELAITRLRKALSRAHKKKARDRLRLVDALVLAGRKREAVEELRRLLVEHPGRSVTITKRLRALGASTALSALERLSRAERYIELRMPERALEELAEGRPPRGRRARAAWLHARGTALYSLRTRYAEAARVLSRAARLRGETAESDAFHAARALARADKDRRAVHAFRRFARRYRKSRLVAQAHYLAAWLELRHAFGPGERNMRRFVDGPHAARAPELKRRGLFALGQRALDRGRFADAHKYFARYADSDEATMVRARGLYWSGRALAASGALSEAHSAYRDAIAVEPLHYYALLSAARLRQAGVDPGPPFGDAKPPPARGFSPLAPKLPDDVRFYARLGLRQDAIDALRRDEQRLRESAPAGREAELLVAAYHALGEYTRARRVVLSERASLLRVPPSPASRWAWEGAYPSPFSGPMTRASLEHDFPAALAYAVMRKESAFDPNVVSYADAIGLMQLLPKTAQELSRVTRDELFDPQTNIALGVGYLAQLRARFDGQELLAIAAYNAGAHRVGPWLSKAFEDGGRAATDRFVERIPIEQTRNYVRRVVSYWARYRYLEAPDGTWPLSLPLELRLPALAEAP